MDTSDYPSLPKLNQLHAQLAANNRRVEEVIDSQLDSIEQLFAAVVAEDWSGVEKVTRQLATLEPDVLGHDVVREAQKVLDELTRAAAGETQSLHLHDLIAACRSVRKNQHWTS